MGCISVWDCPKGVAPTEGQVVDRCGAGDWLVCDPREAVGPGSRVSIGQGQGCLGQGGHCWPWRLNRGSWPQGKICSLILGAPGQGASGSWEMGGVGWATLEGMGLGQGVVLLGRPMDAAAAEAPVWEEAEWSQVATG